jgi:plastocyanin
MFNRSVFLILLACTLALANLQTSQANPIASVQAQIASFNYQPETITIAPGTQITWTNLDSAGHTVTAADRQWSSDLLMLNQSFSYTFTEHGEFEYYCIPHPYMRAFVVVRTQVFVPLARG